jgi:hypothetical protein
MREMSGTQMIHPMRAASRSTALPAANGGRSVLSQVAAGPLSQATLAIDAHTSVCSRLTFAVLSAEL